MEKKAIHVLILDSELNAGVLASLNQRLSELGVVLTRVKTPEEVLKEIAGRGFQVFVCDLAPTKRDLLEFLGLVHRFRPRTRFVVHGPRQGVLEALPKLAAFPGIKPLSKPWTEDEFMTVLALALGDADFANQVQEALLASVGELASEMMAAGTLNDTVNTSLTQKIHVRTARERAQEEAAKIQNQLGRFLQDPLPDPPSNPGPVVVSEMRSESNPDGPGPEMDLLNLPAVRDPKDPAMRIVLNRDATMVRLILYPLEEKYHDLKEIEEELNRKKIVYGLDSARLKELVDTVNGTGKPCLGEVIAKGTPSIDGENGKIRFFVQTGLEKHLAEDEDGKVDYKQLFEIPSVRANELLAEVTDPTPATDGFNVYGARLRGKSGKAIKASPGKGCRYDEETRRFYAEIDGQLIVKASKISVLPIFVVPEDVDLSTGNVQFVGSVLIGGNVTSGFTVIAEGDVRIKGLVEAATIKAGGTVAIQKGVVANDKGYIQAGQDFYAKFLSAADVTAEGNVFVEDTIMNSRVTSSGKVTVSKHKGSIVGGEVSATNGIDCLNLGSDMGVNTTVMVGEQFLMRKKLVEVTELLEKQNAQIKSLTQSQTVFSGMDENDPKLNPKQRVAIQQLKQSIEDLKKRISENEKIKESVVEALNRNCLAKVNVRNIANSNLKIVVGNTQLKTIKTHTFCSFYEDKALGEVRLGAYDGKISVKKVITTK
ncbi:MAG: DUF342 domain-containing protein [Candidatus Cloacimonetes bacterium]|nr:DUF342 domain-containing protein [Candidatus Cloacimonadota bacterium]